MIKHNKQLTSPLGSGWDNRPKGIKPSSIVVHTTSNSRPTTFAHELKYILTSPSVSYHYLIEKSGIVHEILPTNLRAWHAGACLSDFINSRSIGIAWHASVGEKVTSRQKMAAAELVDMLVATHHIHEERVATHRAVALPPGRKVDPAGMSDVEFVNWRNTVFMTPNTRVIGTSPSVTPDQFWRWLSKRKAPIERVVADRIYKLCEWLDIDPAFVAALWKHETSQVPGSIGSSDLFKKSNNAGAIVAYGRWPFVRHNNRMFNKYESPQLGLMHLVMHLKQIYGAVGLLDVETIIPTYAPLSDGNSPQSYIKDVLASMQEMRGM